MITVTRKQPVVILIQGNRTAQVITSTASPRITVVQSASPIPIGVGGSSLEWASANW